MPICVVRFCHRRWRLFQGFDLKCQPSYLVIVDKATKMVSTATRLLHKHSTINHRDVAMRQSWKAYANFLPAFSLKKDSVIWWVAGRKRYLGRSTWCWWIYSRQWSAVENIASVIYCKTVGWWFLAFWCYPNRRLANCHLDSFMWQHLSVFICH